MKFWLWFAFLFSIPFSSFAMNEEATIDDLLKDFSGQRPGATVMVIKNGDVVFAKAYGLANFAEKIPCTTNTNFRLASVTKQFTAMSILILAKRGKLSLDDKLTRFFPEFPAYGKEITIRHLLTHTSGLRPGLSLAGVWTGQAAAIQLACAEKLRTQIGRAHV